MEILYLGHSCFLIRSGEVRILTDPYADSLGLSLGSPEASIVTVSNPLPHHSAWEKVRGDPKVIQGPGEYEVQGVFIEGLATVPMKEGRNTAYLIEVEGLVLGHLGDLDRVPSAQLVEELGRAQVLFLPVGGHGSLDAVQAVETLNLLEPKVAIPMHYRIEGVFQELEPLEAFLRELGLREVTPQRKLVLSRSHLPQETQVVVLEPSAHRS